MTRRRRPYELAPAHDWRIAGEVRVCARCGGVVITYRDPKTGRRRTIRQGHRTDSTCRTAAPTLRLAT